MGAVDEEPTTDARGRRASHRLRDMLTTAVGFVDRAANEELFLIVKADDTMPDAATPTQTGLRLPAAAKQSLTDGIADALEKLAAVAQQVQDCTVDEGAVCPPELAKEIDDVADDLDELAEEFAPEASPAQMKEKGDARAKNKVAKAKAAFPGAAPPFGAKKDTDDAADVTKVAPPGAPPEVSRPPPGTGPSVGGSPQPRGTADNPDVVMKAGRKMAKDRLNKLMEGHALHSQAGAKLAEAVTLHKAAHGCVGEVLKAVGDPAFMQPPGPAPTAQPPSPKPPAAEPEVSPAAGQPDLTGMTKAAVADALAEPMALLTSTLADLKETHKALGDAAALNTLRALTRTPQSLPNDGPPSRPAATSRVAWPKDMAASVRAKRTAKPAT